MLSCNLQDAENAGSISPEGEGNEQQAVSPEISQLRETISRLTNLKSSGSMVEINTATQHLRAALEGESASAGTTQSNGNLAPVQRTAAVMAPPLVAAGPPGWVVLGVLAVGTLAVGVMAYSESRSRAQPRVVPQTKTRDRTQQHRGRLQVQGGGIELSYPWARNAPMTKAEALSGLMGLKSQLPKRELAIRNEAFSRAQAFINSTLVTAPPPISRTFQNKNLPSRSRDARVDIEIRTGVAFA